MTDSSERRIDPEERFEGEHVTLRPVTLADCTPRYLEWLLDPEVNRYLETRWSPQSIDTVIDFVSTMIDSSSSYLFAIVENEGSRHIGNLKIGPINTHHGFADLSYFIGERSFWGRGYASEAIRLASRIAFDRLGVRRLQAGLYEGNRGSARALEKAGFAFEARFIRQLRGPDGLEDHLWYVRCADDPDLG